MGDQQRQRYQVQLSLRQKYQQQLEQLRRDSEQKGTYNTDDYRKAEQALTESLNRQLNENRRYWQQLEVVQGNWKNGVLRAFQDFTVDADNTAGTAEQVFSSAFSNMGNGLATFVTTGKLNFKSFTSSVLSDMAKILAQATMMKSIKGIGSVTALTDNTQGATGLELLHRQIFRQASWLFSTVMRHRGISLKIIGEKPSMTWLPATRYLFLNSVRYRKMLPGYRRKGSFRSGTAQPG